METSWPRTKTEKSTSPTTTPTATTPTPATTQPATAAAATADEKQTMHAEWTDEEVAWIRALDASKRTLWDVLRQDRVYRRCTFYVDPELVAYGPPSWLAFTISSICGKERDIGFVGASKSQNADLAQWVKIMRSEHGYSSEPSAAGYTLYPPNKKRSMLHWAVWHVVL